MSTNTQHPPPQTPRTQVRSRSGGGSPLKPSQARGRQLCASTPGAASRSHRENGCSPWVQLNASGQRPPCSLRHTALRPLGDLPPTAEQPMGSPPTSSLQVSFHYAGRAGVFPSIVCRSSPSTKALRLSRYESPGAAASFFFLGMGFHYRPGKALRHPKTDLVSPRPTFPLTSGSGTTTQQLPSRRCRRRSRPSRHHQGRSGRQIRQSRSSGRRGRSSTLECAQTALPCAPPARTRGRSLRER